MSLIPIRIDSYDHFRADALDRAAQGLGYDVDGWYGYQCWDLAAELWMHISEFSSGLWPHTGPNLAAEEIWTVSRVENAGSSFDLITSLSQVKRGDVIVIGNSAISSVGHVAFADEDYSSLSMNWMQLLGQNQVNPSPDYGHIPTVTLLNVSNFLGAFRYHAWEQPSPTPTLKHKFPWFIYTKKWRNKNNYGII